MKQFLEKIATQGTNFNYSMKLDHEDYALSKIKDQESFVYFSKATVDGVVVYQNRHLLKDEEEAREVFENTLTYITKTLKSLQKKAHVTSQKTLEASISLINDK